MKKQFLFFSLLLIFLTSNAQTDVPSNEDHFTIGILPLTSSNISQTYISIFQASVSKTFAEKNRFTVVDRTKLDEIIKERKLQKQEDFMNSSFLAEQSKSIGAQYLVSGNLSQLTTQSGTENRMDYFTNKTTTVNVTTASVTISLQIIDVSTGMVKASRTFSQTIKTQTTDQQIAINNTIGPLEKNYNAWVNEVFPVPMKIIKIESYTKKGLPEKVFIKGGSDMNLNKDKSIIFSQSSELIVFINETLNVDGKEYKREIPIGKIKIDQVQGEFSICKVTSGAEEIKKKLEEGKTLLLKINKY